MIAILSKAFEEFKRPSEFATSLFSQKPEYSNIEKFMDQGFDAFDQKHKKFNVIGKTVFPEKESDWSESNFRTFHILCKYYRKHSKVEQFDALMNLI